MTDVFNKMPVLRKTTANKIPTMLNVHIHQDMEEYSGWGWSQHVDWICELIGRFGATVCYRDF